MRFFGFGPQPIQSIFGRDIRAIAFGVAIFQIVIAIKMLLLGLIMFGFYYSFLGFFFLPYCIFFLVLGLYGLRCTRRCILERGLNVRLVEKLAVWSWVCGLVVAWGTLVLASLLFLYIVDPFQIQFEMFLCVLAGYVILVFCALVVWSYKEVVFRKLPDNLFGNLEIKLLHDNNDEERQSLVSQPAVEFVPIQKHNNLKNAL
eukprot:TRINITY_DN15114_c0_g2_i1.p2 TRINITY_DN15114_c0_g2~~TRINITY_DN15114_c0_g2_i1.p2  ORF type:complete len:202 (+),score=3.26 TRINITY_DN15114_c0_g2_i1:188-793(+)